jgi:putative ABC transport system permease protein
LPENYGERIARIDGVSQVIPMKVVVNNCRTSLDVVTFRGVPADDWSQRSAPNVNFISGSIQQWLQRKDAAILGETLAARRKLKVGDSFDAAGVNVYVAGIFRSDEPQDQNVGYVHLDFLQRASGMKRLGIVTQFNVKVSDPRKLDEVARAIDALFKTDQQPTQTSSEKSFVARAAADVLSLVGFTRYLGWGCLAAVLALVGNAIVLGVQDRISEHAILQTLGYTGPLIGRLIVAEGLLLSVMGGLVGTVLALLLVQWGRFSLSNEGLSIPLTASPTIFAAGLVLSALLGVLAGLVPAWQASRRDIAASFRAV